MHVVQGVDDFSEYPQRSLGEPLEAQENAKKVLGVRAIRWQLPTASSVGV